MTTTQTPPGSGEDSSRPKRVSDRAPQELFGDGAITFVGAGAAVTLFATAANVYIWGCGAAFVVFFLCLLAVRYRIVARERRWGRRSLLAATVVSGVAIPVLALVPLLIPPPSPSFQPTRAAVQDCRPAGTVKSNPHRGLPPGVPGILSMRAFTCFAKSSAGELPVYMGPGDPDTSGVLGGNVRSWFVCRISAAGVSAWYYTQGDYEGQTKYPQANAWGVIASSLPPDPVVPPCSLAVTDVLPSGKS